MRKLATTLVFIFLGYLGFAQNEQYQGLELAKTLNKGQVYFFELISNDYAIIASFHDVYIINSSYVVVDTVNEVTGQKKTNPLSGINVLDESHFTVSTMRDMYLFELNNSKAVLVKKIAYNKSFPQYKPKHHARTLTQYGYLGEYFPVQNKTTEFYYSSELRDYKQENKLYKGAHSKLAKNFLMIYYENKLKDFYGGKILMNDICMGVAVIFDEVTSEKRTINLPEIEGAEFRYIMFDRIDMKHYLVAKTVEHYSFIYPFDIMKATTTGNRIVVEKNIRAISGGRAFYRKRIDESGLVGYFCTPLKETGLGFGSMIDEVFIEQ